MFSNSGEEKIVDKNIITQLHNSQKAILIKLFCMFFSFFPPELSKYEACKIII